ncbi:MAG TPA: hypothetical protein DCW90_10560 [Lachnospiraceae bacterium]|nr:ABC transporter permease [uncultured Lachnoclostridium sp.]HAU85917.1 hypothetical protein [Lachnospiraceae bacterium]
MIRRFARKTIQKDKAKGICALIAMLLTSILFSTLFTTIIGINKAAEYSRIKTSGTSSQVVLKDCDKKTIDALDRIKENALVKSAGYRKYLADVVNKQLSYNVELSYEDNSYSKHCFQELEAGHMPQDINEIVIDEETIKSLNIEKKIGEAVTLDLRVGKKHVQETFCLSGWFPMNNATEIRTGQVVTSKDYIDKWESMFIQNTIYGQENIDILLRDSKNVERQAVNILQEAGLDSEKVHYSLNPAYLNKDSTMDLSSMFAIVLSILLIILVGYLIINNIFHIATLRDAKQYGQLKTLGMTRRQLGKFVRWQAYYLLLIAVPIGVVIGVMMGKGLLPEILKQTNFVKSVSGMSIGNKEVLCILALSVVFIIFTTIISILGPIRTIGELSAIESTKLELKLHGGNRKTSDGGKLHKFAYYNITRNKKNTLSLIISISLPILLVSISFSILGSFDMNKYLSKMIYSDYQVATSNYFKSEYQMDDGEIACLSQDVINEIENSGLINDGGIIYGSCNDYHLSIDEEESRDDYWINFYGVSKFNLRSNMFVEKEVDLKKFFYENGILEGVWLNNDGSVMQGTSKYNIGDKVTFQMQGGKEKECQIIGHIILGEGVMDTENFGDGTTYEFYGSTNLYLELMDEPKIMAYTFDAKKGSEGNAEQIMKNCIDSYPDTDYRSKDTLEVEFNSLKNTVMIICTLLCIILSLIAFLNLINVFVTSIFVRKGEFATMRSIGMTSKQQRRMLFYEMFYYCISSFALSMLLSVFLSRVLLERISRGMQFLTYNENLIVFAYILLVILIIGEGTVILCERNMNRKNVAERLHEE